MSLSTKLAKILSLSPYIVSAPTIFVIALGTALTGVVELLFPHQLLDQTSLGHAFPLGVEIFWAALLVVGGLLTTYGMVSGSTELEAGGLTLLATTFWMDLVVLIDQRGFAASSISVFTFGFLGLGYIIRAITIVFLRDFVRRVVEDMSKEIHE